VSELAGDRDVAATTLRIPHPYTRAMAEEWIATLGPAHAERRGETFAIVLPSDGVIGSIGLSLHLDHRRAELGYWVGKPYWGRGYVTEAARRVLAYAFGDLGLHRVHAHYMSGNAASGAVMRKLGMTYEGILRHHTWKNGEYHDVECYGVLAEEFGAGGPEPSTPA
jgi:RimJ/RimL family protein N-acetyltransferase